MKRFFNRYPKIGKTVSTLLGAVEVLILEAIRYNNKLNSKYYLKKMDFFSKVYGSKIIPLDISLHGVNRIASTEEVLNIIKQIPSLSIGYCYCRATRKKCDNELWTCIHVGNAKNIREIGEKSITRNSTVKEVEKILSKANERGLIHQLITAPTSEYFYVICSCCPCCCVMLQTVLLQHSHRKKKYWLTSKFVSVHNQEQCIACGSCSKYCYFSARSFFNNQLVYQSKKCVGYGLCVTKYPIGAITMKRRKIYEN